jgi:toxin-antitoxin system PIN domain toxin
VKVVDLNVLIYATDETATHHAVAKAWLDRTMSSTETVGIATLIAIGFVRLTTNPRVMESPLDVATSVGVVRGWYRRPNVTAPAPTPRHYQLLDELLAPIGTAGNLVSDAHLAALAIEHGAELCSFDRDFGRFSGVRWVEPGSTGT